MAEKRYYWLKLHKDFFKRHEIRIIEDMPNGKDYILFYLKLLVESVTHEGSLRFSDTIPYNEQMLATITNTNVDVVKTAMKIFVELNMIEILDDQTVFMTDVAEMIGSESSAAERKRKSRAIQESEESGNKLLPEQKQHIPYIESYTNEKRYNGNYYNVFNRDDCKCALCGSIEQLCVHHIDGYDEKKPENSNANKMITLCRQCHSQVHRSGKVIPEKLLISIGYYDSHAVVTDVSQDGHIENRDKRIDIRDKSIDKEGESVYGRFENVTLSPEEYKDVCDKGYADLIEEMSEAIKSQRFSTESCYASLLSWGRRRDAYKKDGGKLKSKPSFDIDEIAKKAKMNEEYDI